MMAVVTAMTMIMSGTTRNLTRNCFEGGGGTVSYQICTLHSTFVLKRNYVIPGCVWGEHSQLFPLEWHIYISNIQAVASSMGPGGGGHVPLPNEIHEFENLHTYFCVFPFSQTKQFILPNCPEYDCLMNRPLEPGKTHIKCFFDSRWMAGEWGRGGQG